MGGSGKPGPPFYYSLNMICVTRNTISAIIFQRQGEAVSEAKLRTILREVGHPDDPAIETRDYKPDQKLGDIHSNYSANSAKTIARRIQDDIRAPQQGWDVLPQNKVKLTSKWSSLLGYATKKDLG